MTDVTPPRWAEVVLGFLLAPPDRQPVSGDLLEDYRERVFPALGRRRADLWYVSQVAGFAWRANGPFAALLGGAFVARTALDWLVPTTDFHTRATVSTAVSGGIFVCAGFLASWRMRSPGAGAFAGIATGLMAALISMSGAALLLAIRHDAQALAAIEGSGGLSEAFTLPVLLLLPGAVLGALGGVCGGVARKLSSRVRV